MVTGAASGMGAATAALLTALMPASARPDAVGALPLLASPAEKGGIRSRPEGEQLVQALLLFNIGESELTAGELRTRGYYLGSNVSYNLKKLVEMGYIHYKRSDTDRRSVRVSLTDKGMAACDVIHKLYHRQLGSVQSVGEITGDDFKGLNKALVRLERFWSDQIRYRL